MKKRIMSILLVLVLLFTLGGCNQEKQKEGEYQIYYLNMDKTKLVSESYDSTGAQGEALLMELLNQLISKELNLFLHIWVKKTRIK